MEITGLVDLYKKNIDQWRELEDKISGQYDIIAWTQFLGERSKNYVAFTQKTQILYGKYMIGWNESWRKEEQRRCLTALWIYIIRHMMMPVSLR